VVPGFGEEGEGLREGGEGGREGGGREDIGKSQVTMEGDDDFTQSNKATYVSSFFLLTCLCASTDPCSSPSSLSTVPRLLQA